MARMRACAVRANGDANDARRVAIMARALAVLARSAPLNDTCWNIAGLYSPFCKWRSAAATVPYARA